MLFRSSLPAICYRQLKKVKLLVHYHEIVTLDELNDDRKLNKFLNKIEAKNYTKFDWISHTNRSRLEIFTKQYKLQRAQQILRVLPNYPPDSWLKFDAQRLNESNIVKLLHIGTISTNGMYLNELLNAFGSKDGFTIDFYSHYFSKDVVDLISIHSNCKINGAIDYDKIVQLKGIYDVGLVLYSGQSLNFVYNAPNKIFEYLALDLDVWCSDKLKTAKEYERLDCYPKMIMVDYRNLNKFDVELARSRKDLNYIPSSNTCSTVYCELKSFFQKDLI